MKELEAILVKYDIAGCLVIHTPGHSEFLNKINPRYSCAKTEGDTIRIKSKLADFNDDKELQKKVLTDTVNMFDHFSGIVSQQALMYMDIFKKLNEHLDIESTGGNLTSNTT